ncbi:MAG TPA: hypothetical protein VHE12_04750 [bacterium]|nr:hypothetical protein [bacterium]
MTVDESFQDDLQKQVLEATVKAIEAKIAGLTCPVHGQNPKLKFSEDSGPGRQKMSFDCCCSELATLLQEKINT